MCQSHNRLNCFAAIANVWDTCTDGGPSHHHDFSCDVHLLDKGMLALVIGARDALQALCCLLQALACELCPILSRLQHQVAPT